MKKKLLIAAGVLGLIVVGGAVWQLQAAPAIGAVTANPAYVVINTPTNVLFTAHIPDPSVSPTSVNLLQTDAAGKAIRTVGLMRDDGTNGDATAADKIFGYTISANRSAVGQEYYRVSAGFKGVLQRVQSPHITVYLDPFPLPPDPGEAGKQTLEGIDSDHDGMRDDIQRWIGISYPTDPATQRALRQTAAALQAALIVQNDGDAQSASGLELAAARCLAFTDGAIDAHRESRALSVQLLNTSHRQSAYRSYAVRVSPLFDSPSLSELQQYCVN